MSVYVSIHDVSPALALGAMRAFTMCRSLGFKPALLVVPNWHGVWPLEEHPEFVDWLRSCAASGSDVFLHGYRHDEAGSRRRLRHRVQAWGRTLGEGEFLALDRSAARRRIQAGLDLLARLELKPVGFVAPAWLAQQGTPAVARELGLDLYEDASTIRLLRPGRSLDSPVFRWSARTRFRACASAVVARGRWLAQRHAPHLRIAIHPPDVFCPRTVRSVVSTLLRVSDARTGDRYRDLIPPDGRALPPHLDNYALAPSR